MRAHSEDAERLAVNGSAVNGSDPLDAAVAAGIAAGRARRRPPPAVRARARQLREAARGAGDPAAAVAELLTLVERYPSAEEFQKIVGRLLNEMEDPASTVAAWSGIATRFPHSLDPFLALVEQTYRHCGFEAAREVIHHRFPQMPADLGQLWAYAEACNGIGDTAAGDAAFDRLRLLFARRKSLFLKPGWGFAGPVRPLQLPGKLLGWIGGANGRKQQLMRIRRALEELGEDTHRDKGGHKRSANRAVRHLELIFDRALTLRASADAGNGAAPRGVVLLTGSLGSGGAERQLVNTAIGLKARSLADPACRPLTVLARSLKERADGDFFLPELIEAEIAVRAYREAADFNGNLRDTAVRPILDLLRFLPKQMAEAVVKATDLLREINPAVVHIWQDGLVHAAGLAAVLAGAPRIILNPRSVPPPERRRFNWLEYSVVYRSLLRAPGVRLAVNSRRAASGFADWLGIDLADIEVIPNGVTVPRREPDPGAEAMYRAFDARTGGASSNGQPFTVGTVMRLDNNKRPLLWIDSALKLLKILPEARFIVVGDGPLATTVMRRVRAAGAADRFLFPGRSACIGYWLDKMDAFMLLSEHEGLPNTLIEAQLCGLPIVTSPAGGAVETLIPEVTGIVTSLHPTPLEVSQILAALAGERTRLAEMGRAAAGWAARSFSVERMMDRTLALYAAAGQAQALPPAGVARPLGAEQAL